MTLRVLGSGSAGNSLAVRCGESLVLVDLGFAYAEEKRRIESCGMDIAGVSAVLFTHDHADHCRGAGTFRKKHPHVPFFANGGTADAIAALAGANDGWMLFENGETFDACGIQATAFSISHDAADPVGYTLRSGGRTLFIGTDIGCATANVRDALSQADCAVLESNHDPQLLETSGRPPSLIRRIAGRSGHLSNEAAAELFAAANPPALHTLLLGHLSRQCNSPSLAAGVFSRTLADLGRTGVKLAVLDQDSPSGPCEI